jgi:hypothetical protein
MSDGRVANGGPRPGAGRKPKQLSEQLRRLLDEAWDDDERKATIEAAVTAAKDGDMVAFRTLMAYGYGTPPNGDELGKQEAIDAEIENLLATLEAELSAPAWAEVRAVLQLGESEGEEATEGDEAED